MIYFSIMAFATGGKVSQPQQFAQVKVVLVKCIMTINALSMKTFARKVCLLLTYAKYFGPCRGVLMTKT